VRKSSRQIRKLQRLDAKCLAPIGSWALELNVVSRRLLLHSVFMRTSRVPQTDCAMNIFYIIGVVVVVIFVAGFFGLHV
jgi:hypothetical protein